MATTAVAEHSHGLVNTAAPAKTRAATIQSHDVGDFTLLTGREEEWRFTPLRRLRGLHDGSVAVGGPVQRDVAAVPVGVRVETVKADDPRLGTVLTPFDRPSAAAFTSVTEALVVTVAPDAVITEPVTIRTVGTDTEHASYGHLFLDVGPSAQATIVLDHVGSTLLADNVEINIGANAQLTVVSIADWAADAVQLQHQKATLAADARLTHHTITLGGNLVRQYLSAEFTGHGGEVVANGLYFADANQHLEHRLFIDHAVPDCRSNVNYRGALQGKDAHTIWVGDVLIQAAATGTDTYEINRNLVLTDGARADSVPNLEIETGEIVGAGHASTTGRFDDEQLFYLQSRGIDAETARRLVVRGFFAELVSKIGIPDLQDRVVAAVEARLAKAGA